jgi:predicted AlkP superfamily phosphohydrolase/phosphomutase
MYVAMDELVGETRSRLDDDTALFVMSDHGFKPFRRAVDLNRWLLENRYLYLKQGATSSDRAYLADVDWQKTRAFALGLAGIFVNEAGREVDGIVAAGREKEELVAEIASALTGLRDDEQKETAIHEAVPKSEAYTGPYVAQAPDIIIGYSVGYRVSWLSAVGKTGDQVFADNTKAWSGDHCIHPDLVPGVLFSNWKLDQKDAQIIDLAPTALELLGMGKPAYMDGKSLLCNGT